MLRILNTQSKLCRYYTSNFYRILNVKIDASQDDIKKQFHILAKQYHPDSPHSKDKDEEHFKAIVEAYNTLSDVEQRAKYDRQQQQETNNGSKHSGYSQSSQSSQQSYQSSQQQQQQQQYNRQQYQQERPRKYDFEDNFKPYSKRQDYFSQEYTFLDSMRQAPELYLFSVVIFAITLRWYLSMLEQRRHYGSNSYPEDPEFVRERERDQIKRFGSQAVPNKRIKKIITNHECKNIPENILNEMELSGMYQLSPICYERLDTLRSQEGSVFTFGHADEDDQDIPVVSTEQQQVDYSKLSIFKKVKGIDAHHLNQQNINQVINNRTNN